MRARCLLALEGTFDVTRGTGNASVRYSTHSCRLVVSRTRVVCALHRACSAPCTPSVLSLSLSASPPARLLAPSACGVSSRRRQTDASRVLAADPTPTQTEQKQHQRTGEDTHARRTGADAEAMCLLHGVHPWTLPDLAGVEPCLIFETELYRANFGRHIPKELVTARRMLLTYILSSLPAVYRCVWYH